MPSITSKSGRIRAKRNDEWEEVISLPYDLSNISEVDCYSNESWCRITVVEGHVIHLSNTILAASKCLISSGSYYYYPRR